MFNEIISILFGGISCVASDFRNFKKKLVNDLIKYLY